MNFDNLRIITKETKDLSKKEIQNICNLKNSYWKYGKKSQMRWFKNNIKKFDLNNMLILNEKLIGYTLIRNRNHVTKNKKKYVLIDSVILNKAFQKKGYGDILMGYNNLIIKKIGFEGILLCNKSLVKFYKKFNWNKTSKSLYNIDNLKKKNYVVLKYNGI